MKVVEVDENTKLPLKLVAICGVTVTPVIFWLAALSFSSSNANAKIDAIQVDRELHHEEYTKTLIKIESRLASIEQELKDLK